MSSNRPEDRLAARLHERVVRSVSPVEQLRRLHRTRRRERLLAITAGVAVLAIVIGLPILWLGRGGTPTPYGTTAPTATSTEAKPDYLIECTLKVRFDANMTISESATIEPSLGATQTISVPPYQLAMSVGASDEGVMFLRVELFEETPEGALRSLDISAAGGLPTQANPNPGRLVVALGPVWANVNQITPTCVVAG
jgi:hypothetical protein